MLSTPTFFIADRLRGIPLVSNGMVKEDMVMRQRENQSLVTYDESSKESYTSINDTSNSNSSSSELATMKKSIQVGKRNAAIDMVHQQAKNSKAPDSQTTVGVLFKSSGITASTANIVRNKQPSTSTTTQKPSSKRAKSYIRYETVKPKLLKQSTSKPNSKTITTTTTTMTTSPSTAAPTVTTTANTTPIPIPTTTQTMPPTTTTSTTTSTPIITTIIIDTKKPATAKMSSKSPSEMSRATTTGNHLLSTKSLKIEKVALENGRPITTNVPILTRVAQATQTTQPGFQRRTPQAVISSKFTNRPNDGRNGFAGPNWVLFNRQDGQFSVFEVLTMISCIMIVSTIFLVIIFNWVKFFQSKYLIAWNNQI